MPFPANHRTSEYRFGWLTEAEKIRSQLGDPFCLGLTEGESLAGFDGNVGIRDQPNAAYLDKTILHGLFSSELKFQVSIIMILHLMIYK